MNLVNFWHELRRRRVVRVAVAYCAVAWLLIEVSATIVPVLELPTWIIRAVILSAMGGFPIAVLLAWMLDFTPRGIEVTDADRRDRHAVSSVPVGVSRTIFSVSIIGILLAASALSLFQLNRARIQSEELIRLRLLEVRELANLKQYANAYAIAVEIEESLAGNETLETLWPEISERLTVTSEPAGASVTARSIQRSGAGELGEIMQLGSTPIEDLRVPRIDLLLNITLGGYARVERVANGDLGRYDLVVEPGIRIHIPLVPEDEAPENMVFVPGGEYQIVSSDLPIKLTAIIDDFFIDKLEVSNSAFREFVENGGYSTRELWPERLTAKGESVGFDSLMRRLVDQSGRNAPRAWLEQSFPTGRENHPVTGVSWYETHAYCAFRGKRLPSVFQWEKAARDGLVTYFEGVIMPWGYANPVEPKAGRANFAGDGTVPVDAQPAGMSPYGAYAMAGNVKEWLINAAGNGRMLTGGSWEDPDYLFSEFNHYPSISATPSLGFRCARVRADDARRFRDQGDFRVDMNIRTPSYETVDAAKFEQLLAFYRYDPRPLRAEILETVDATNWVRKKISYIGPQNERVLAYLWLPKNAAPPYQTIFFVPGVEVFFSRRVNESAEQFMGPHIRAGRAVFAVVLKGMIEREWGPDFELPAPDSIRFRDLMIRQATELRLGLDYLETRNDIDMRRVAYTGISLGAGSRLGWAAVDDRYSAVIFIGGGIDERVKPNLPEADNVNFAPYISAPKLLLNGMQDDEHPWLTRGLPLWNLLTEPKRKVLIDGVGHIPPANSRVPAVEAFLDEQFGPSG